MFHGQRRKNRRSWNTDGGCDNVFLKVGWGGVKGFQFGLNCNSLRSLFFELL